MCGIVYSKNFHGRDSTSTVLKRFENQRSRGTTSFGFYLPTQDKMCHNVKEGRIKSLLNRTKGDNDEILFHHRYSTSTPDVRNACHPFSTKDTFGSEYIGVHNGVIQNTKELQVQHEGLGINYVSMQKDGRFNDSEALIYDIARYLEGDVDELTAKGSIAFIVIKRNGDGKPVKLFFGRNYGNPLKMKMTKNSLTLSSVGEGDDVEPNYLYSYDYDTKQLVKRRLFIPASYYGRSYSPPTAAKKSDSATGAWGYPKSGSSVCAPRDNPNYERTIEDDWDDYYTSRYGVHGPIEGRPQSTGTKVSRLPHINIRGGSYEKVKNQILEECSGDYVAAAIKVIGEADEGSQVLLRAHDIIESIEDMEGADFASCVESYDELESYVKMLEHISSEFEEKSLDNTTVHSRDEIDEDSDDPEVIRQQVELALSKG